MVTALLLEQKEGISPEKVLTLCAGIGLVIYGAILAREWSSGLSHHLWESGEGATDDNNIRNGEEGDGDSGAQPQQRTLGDVDDDEERAAGQRQRQEEQEEQEDDRREDQQEAQEAQQGVRRGGEKRRDRSVSEEEGDGECTHAPLTRLLGP